MNGQKQKDARRIEPMSLCHDRPHFFQSATLVYVQVSNVVLELVPRLDHGVQCPREGKASNQRGCRDSLGGSCSKPPRQHDSGLLLILDGAAVVDLMPWSIAIQSPDSGRVPTLLRSRKVSRKHTGTLIQGPHLQK